MTKKRTILNVSLDSCAFLPVKVEKLKAKLIAYGQRLQYNEESSTKKFHVFGTTIHYYTA